MPRALVLLYEHRSSTQEFHECEFKRLYLTSSSGFDFAVAKESLMMLEIFLREGLNKYSEDKYDI